ncbi:MULTISPECIES: hypothetical protein [Kaistia]|uniref:DUF1579 domain-containing protein n=1 Tax=Kaistia nematophila TaxID=2994654 RepID=A0A9X3E0L6_9HYPH|nr:hypothetical protein [Kaistia nematophila]MBN9026837.1 hypothetical protein [Hyphomicrobiales bacterium]MCX5568357.1 hypothetical protein [Kaistia nematophila]
MRPQWPIMLCLFAGPALSATGDEQSFQNRFAGSWTGGGPVRRNAESPIIDADCAVTGDHAPNRMSISGSCRGAVVFTRDISADVTFNPATGRYTGTYVGARAGPATIVGKRNGNRVNFTMTWPKPVNGSTRARMSILNDGQGMLRIQVVSQPQANGPATTLSDLTFRKH